MCVFQLVGWLFIQFYSSRIKAPNWPLCHVTDSSFTGPTRGLHTVCELIARPAWASSSTLVALSLLSDCSFSPSTSSNLLLSCFTSCSKSYMGKKKDTALFTPHVCFGAIVKWPKHAGGGGHLLVRKGRESHPNVTMSNISRVTCQHRNGRVHSGYKRSPKLYGG